MISSEAIPPIAHVNIPPGCVRETLPVESTAGTSHKIHWNQLTPDQLCKYGDNTKATLASCIHELTWCNDVHCQDPAHVNAVE